MDATLWTSCVVAGLGLVLALAFLPRRSVSAETESAEVVTMKV